MFKKTGLLLFLIFLTFRSHALEFEDIVAGARAGGLGWSYTALAEGYQTVFFNPGGLAFVENENVATGFGHYYTVPITSFHLNYLKPFYEGITGAAAWQSTRSSFKHLNRFSFSWSQMGKMPSWLGVQRQRFGWGMDLRILSLQKRTALADSFDSKLGMGVSMGALLDLPETKTKLGASLIGLDSANLDLKGPFMNLGVSQRYKFLNFLLDFRAREGLSTFYPGIEAGLYGDLLQIRAGRGIRLGEIQTVAFGFGFNVLPLTVDVGFHVPTEGLHRREGAAMVSVAYAFGGPHFYQKFSGFAAEESQNLAREIDELEAKKRRARTEAAELDRDLRVLREEAKVLRSRVREEGTESELRRAESERKREEEERARRKPPEEQWPKYRKVKAGDTLRAIAIQAYGDPNLWELIYKANPDKIVRGLPKVGEVLTIPKP